MAVFSSVSAGSAPSARAGADTANGDGNPDFNPAGFVTQQGEAAQERFNVMVPMSVQNAWTELQDSKKTSFCRLLAKRQPLIFSRWVEAAGLKSFRHDSVVNRKAGAASRLDAVLFKSDEGLLAQELLVLYFTELAPQINDEYLQLLESAGNEERETKLKIYAQLSQSHKASPFIQLYLATALWVGGLDEEDLATVASLAAELSSTAGV